jgi:hypothetical protein
VSPRSLDWMAGPARKAVLRPLAPAQRRPFPSAIPEERVDARADGEPVGQAGEGVAVSQMRQGEQGLPAGIEARPSGADLGAVVADQAGEVVQGAGEQRNRGRAGQQRQRARPRRRHERSMLLVAVLAAQPVGLGCFGADAGEICRCSFVVTLWGCCRWLWTRSSSSWLVKGFSMMMTPSGRVPFSVRTGWA